MVLYLSLVLCILCSGCQVADHAADKGPEAPESVAFGGPAASGASAASPAASSPLLPAPSAAVASPLGPSSPSPSAETAPAKLPETTLASPAPEPAASAGTAPAKKDKPAGARQSDRKAKSGQARGNKEQAEAIAKGGKARSLSELRRKYSDTFIFRGSSGSKQIALTFDDAPDTLYTPKVLDILNKYGVKATFFLLGCNAKKHPEVVKRIVREGHVIGNHSYGHPLLKKLPQEQFIQEIRRSEQILASLAGYTPRLVRPPYGAVNDDELAWLKSEGYITVNWNIDPEDWRGLSGNTIMKRSVEAAGSGSIILMHSATGQGGNLQGTVDALPGIIESLRGKGYNLVTLPEMLHTKKGK